MPSPVISVENLSKSYRLGAIGGAEFKEDFARWWAKVRSRPDPLLKIGEEHRAPNLGEKFWALQDVSFQVREGEVLGIIGRNGAGKSTLLKILSQVTAPTSGEAKIRGRIASLLEVGTGFHPELTGRENIFLNGAILGMTRLEIKRKFDDIVAFCEIEKFLDTPVKRYSSGMYVRLAFAVAAHLEPEILIVDEVLAVGDAEFQKKCLGKMQEASSQQGRTILFVSHNLPALRTLCTRALILESGQLRFEGDVHGAIDRYMSLSSSGASDRRWDNSVKAPGDDVFTLRRVRAFSANGIQEYCPIDEDVIVQIDFDVLRFEESVSVSIHLYTQGVCAFVGGDPSRPLSPGKYQATARIPANLLNNAVYTVSVFLITEVTNLRVQERDVISFNVEETGPRGEYLGHVMGAVRPEMKWDISLLANTTPVAA